MRFSINPSEKGQALTEFILFFFLFSALFGSLLLFLKTTHKGLDSLTINRNMCCEISSEGSGNPYNAYCQTSPELSRFREQFESAITGRESPILFKVSGPFKTFQLMSASNQNPASQTIDAFGLPLIATIFPPSSIPTIPTSTSTVRVLHKQFPDGRTLVVRYRVTDEPFLFSRP